MLAVLIAACGEPTQAGTEEDAAQAASAFLDALRAGRTQYAWDHLSPATREEIYNEDIDQFAEELRAAEWGELAWEIGPVTDYDISWGVHAQLEPPEALDLLVGGGLAGGWGSDGVVLLVQFVDDGQYLVAGQGLDTDLR